jgi:hypothetical protein
LSKDVGRLDVPVDDAVGVGVFEGVEDVGTDGEGVLLGQLSAVELQILVDVHPVDELHHEIELAFRGFAESRRPREWPGDRAWPWLGPPARKRFTKFSSSGPFVKGLRKQL